MNYFMAGGHFFGVGNCALDVQGIYPRSHYYPLLLKLLDWSQQGPKDDQSGPLYRVQLLLV